MPKCKKCPAKIRFLKTPEGNWMPIDPEPNPDGNLVMDGENDLGEPLVRPVDLFTPTDAVRYMPHWATCTDPDAFRGGKR